MADKSISQLPVAQTLSGNEVTVIVQSGVTKQVAISLIANAVAPGKLISNVTMTPDYYIEFFYSDGTTSTIGPIPGFESAYVNGAGHLILVETNGNQLDAGSVVGPQGVSGYSGFSGISGYSGFSGISGYSGDSGISGYSGSGISGYSGESGISGYSGESGISGYSGESGISGYSGDSGISGYSGFSGISGYSGFSGISGYSGFSGISGYSGFSGISGYSGNSGISGYSGAVGAGGIIGNYGSFFDTTDQTGSLTAQVVSVNNTTSAVGFSRSGTGTIVIANPGTYKLTYSIQLLNVDNAIHYADIWLKYNGSNYPDSNTRFYIPARKDSNFYGYAVATVDFIGTSVNPNDTVELWWITDSTQVSIETIAAYDGVPETPGVILNVSQVAYSTSGYSGFSGISGYSGFSGISGYSGNSGISGYSGESGYSGFSGISGYSGQNGTIGHDGASGYSGFSGISGYSGLGLSGYSGYSGYSGAQGTSSYIRTSFTATAGQTTFTVDYTVGFLEVYLNGVLLNGSDYTASNGTSVVLASAAAAGDIVETIAFNTQAVLNTTANNIAGGAASQLVYQSAPNTTGFVNNGTSGQALISAGSSAPAWGTLGVAGGGTGQTSYTDGQLLIGNSTGNTLAKATLTAGTGIGVTNGSGSITIANTGVTAYPGSGLAVSTGSAWGTSKAAPTGDVVGTTDTQTLSAKTVTGLKETKVAMAASDIDLSAGNYFTKTISATTTFTVSNVPATGTVASFILVLTNAGSQTINWSTSFGGSNLIKWAGGTAPTLTSAGVDSLGFYTFDGGTTWTGLVLGKDIK